MTSRSLPGTPSHDPRIAQLTLEEKVSLVMGSDFWHTAKVDRLGIPSLRLADGPHGLRVQPDAADHISMGGSLPATCFPTACALGSSWDTDLAREIGVALGEEARALGVSVLLGPGINIKRSPLCGRNFEYFSEDPMVSGEMGAAVIGGVQSQRVGTSLKHYAVNNQETDRLRVSAEVDERALREIYLAGFERAVTKSHPWTVMASYNKVNGTYASEHTWLLTEVLRGEWQFDGLVVSDWGAVHDPVAALSAGLDLEMPPALGVSDTSVLAAVRSGRLDETVVDAAVARVLQLTDRAAECEPLDGFDINAHHALARRAAAESAVLLKNEGHVLPLLPAAGQVLAVIGQFAQTPRYQGAGSSQVNPTRLDTPVDELRAAVPDGVEVAFAPGFGLDADTDDEALAREAVELARRAEHVVVFLGVPQADESEGYDRTHLQLPKAQTALLARLAVVTDKLIVVLANGSAVQVADWQQHAAAVLECWLMGQGAGGAVADLLMGRSNPSGRLAETLPVRLEDTPSYLNFPGEEGHVRYGEGVFVGYRGYDALDRDVSYPFGHGLSYTTFHYRDLAVDLRGSVASGDLSIEVAVTVANTGDRAGKEVVQIYVGDLHASVARPVRELRAWSKVNLGAGQEQRVKVLLDARDLAFWSTATGGWLVEAGEFEIAVGASSRDLRVRTAIDVAAPPVVLPLNGMSTLEEWLEHPHGGPRLRAVFGLDDSGKPQGALGNPDLLRIVGNFPLSTLSTIAAFDLGVDQQSLRELAESTAFGMSHPSVPTGSESHPDEGANLLQ